MSVKHPVVDLGKLTSSIEIPIWVPMFDTCTIRDRINNILSGDSVIPKYLGCPPGDEIKSVQHQVVSEMAYRYWEFDGRPDGVSEKHWFLAESDWYNALSGVWM